MKGFFKFFADGLSGIAAYMKEMLSASGDASYTRGAGFTTLYFYLLWATYKVFGGAAIKDVDIPIQLAGFLWALYFGGEYFRTKRENAKAITTEGQYASPASN